MRFALPGCAFIYTAIVLHLGGLLFFSGALGMKGRRMLQCMRQDEKGARPGKALKDVDTRKSGAESLFLPAQPS